MALFLSAPAVLAHDDPVITVRIMCNGFNVLDMDAVLGEISDSATLRVDRSVGPGQIEAWVKDQMDHDLRIQIVDMGAPEKLPDGYTLAWTARFSREDWRRAGIQARMTTNEVVIHNGRIVQWTSQLKVTDTDAISGGTLPSTDGGAVPSGGGVSPGTSGGGAVTSGGGSSSGTSGGGVPSGVNSASDGRVASAARPVPLDPRSNFPELFGIPVTFVALGIAFVALGAFGLYRRLR